MLHGEGGKVARDASYCEDSGFENSPVLNRLFDQSRLFFIVMSPTHNAQVLRMDSNTSTRI